MTDLHKGARPRNPRHPPYPSKPLPDPLELQSLRQHKNIPQ